MIYTSTKFAGCTALAFAFILYFSFALSSVYQKRTFYTYVKFVLFFAVAVIYMVVIEIMLELSWMLLFTLSIPKLIHFPVLLKFYPPLIFFFFLLSLSALLMKKLFNVPAKPLYHLAACVFVVSLLIPTVQYVKIEYLTYKYKVAFVRLPVPPEWGGDEHPEIYKVLDVSRDFADTLIISCNPPYMSYTHKIECGANYLFFERK